MARKSQRGTESPTDALLNEIEGLLARLRQRYAGRPDLERHALLMVALEREQVVAVAYREDAVTGRVSALAVDEEVRGLIRQTLVWIWKDEEVHATYLRGYLLSTGRRLSAALVFGRQIYGALSGWVTSTRELAAPRKTPLRSVTASLLLIGGRVLGLVPPAVARALRYRSFRHYCELNAVLERTAALAYTRLAELARTEDERQLFARVGEDEARHAEAFLVLAGILDDSDRPVPGLSGSEVTRRLAAISPWFIPAAQRGTDGGSLRPPFGDPSPVFVGAGAGSPDLKAIVADVFGGAGVPALIGGGNGRVAVRTSFMLGYDRRDRSNVVSPAVLDEVARYALEHGATEVSVIEAPTVYGRYYQHRSVGEVAAYFGYSSEHYRVVDAGADQVPFEYQRGLQQNTICRTWLDAGTRIILAKLRSDPSDYGHLCLCAMEGMANQIADSTYTARSIEYRTATMMMLDVAPPDAAVVDAWGPVADGPVGVMGCRRPAHSWRLYAGRDALSVDRAVLADMGLPDARRAPIIRRAIHWFGIALEPVDVRGSPGPFGAGFRGPWSRPWWRVTSALCYPIYVYASGEGRVFVPQMDEIAFPRREKDGVVVRAVRRSAQLVFGVRPPEGS